MVLNCPYCERKFSGDRKIAFGRMSKHIWKEHSVKHKKKIRKGQRESKSQLDAELEYTDDMILQSLMDAGIPIKQPRQMNYQQPMYQPIPYYGEPTQHESIAGALITAFKLGQKAYTVYKVAKPVVKKVKARRQAKK